MNSPTRRVHINSQYARKIRYKHRIKPEDFKYIQAAIEGGLVLRIADNKLAFHLWDKSRNAYFEAVVKVMVGVKDENWVCSFHRQSKPEIRRRQKKYPIVLR